MIALISLFMILILSLTVIRVGAISLELTGIAPEVASFQAQSAFSGVGFTTAESESIVNHPVRRKIIRRLILVGSAGITSVLATVIITFTQFDAENIGYRSIILCVGLLVIYLIARSELLYKIMKGAIVKALSLNKSLVLHDYYEILGVAKGYSISRIKIKDDNWAIGHKLKDLNLNAEGTIILSINRTIEGEDKFLIPSGETEVLDGDQLTLYGRCAGGQCLAARPKGADGDARHNKHVEEQKRLEELQEVSS